MGNFAIVSDSSCDIGLEAAEKNEIVIVPFEVTFDGKKYFKENIDILIEEFYRTIRAEDVYPKTSLPSIQAYSDTFREVLENGQDVLCFCLTSKFSGSYQSAYNAKELLEVDYPNRKIVVMDSQLCTTVQGALVLEAARMRRDGLSLDEIVKKCEKMRTMSKVYVTFDSLSYLQKGGRIGKVGAVVGSLLSIKPVIVFMNGELNPHSKIRGRKKAAQKCMSLINEDILDEKHKYIVTFMHSDEIGEITEIRDEMVNEHGYPNAGPVSYLGVTIGSHSGPGSVAIGYMIKYEYV